MEKNYFSIILYHTDSDRNNKREKIFSSSCLYITLYIYIYNTYYSNIYISVFVSSSKICNAKYMDEYMYLFT